MATESPLIGRTIAGKFRIVRLIGKGGMAAVFAAVQPGQGGEVAVKVMKRELVRDRTVLKRFQREAKAASQLSHPHTVRVIDYGVDGEDAYIAMELARGKDLLQALAEQRPMVQARAAHIVAQVCSALGAAHDRGIIHRDLKPENIMLVEGPGEPFGESVKVLDFGIAKIVAPPQGSKPNGPNTITRSALTRAGTIVGTPAYMSPEQCRGTELDARSDIYSVGVLLYQLVTGQVPFLGETPLHTAMRHIHAAPTPPRDLRPELTESIEDIILKALSKSPGDRQQSALEIERALLTEVGPGQPERVIDAASWSNRTKKKFASKRGDDSSAPTGVHGPAALGATLGRELKYAPKNGDDLDDDDDDDVRTRVKSDPHKVIRTHLGMPPPARAANVSDGTPTSPDQDLRVPTLSSIRTTAVIDVDTPPDSVETPQQPVPAPDSDDDDEQPTALKHPEELAAMVMESPGPSVGFTPTALAIDPKLIGRNPETPKVAPAPPDLRPPMASEGSFPTPVHALPESDDDLPTDRKARIRTMRLDAHLASNLAKAASERGSEPSLDPSVVVASDALTAAADGVAATEPSLDRPAIGIAKSRPTLRSADGKPTPLPTQKLDARAPPPEVARTLKMSPDRLATPLPLPDRPSRGVKSAIERLPGTTGVLLGVGIGVAVSILFAVAIILLAR